MSSRFGKVGRAIDDTSVNETHLAVARHGCHQCLRHHRLRHWSPSGAPWRDVRGVGIGKAPGNHRKSWGNNTIIWKCEWEIWL